MPAEVLFEEVVRPPRLYYPTWLVALVGGLALVAGRGTPWPLFTIVVVAAAIAVAPLALNGPNIGPVFPLRILVTGDELIFGYYSESMIAVLPWTVSSRAAGRVRLPLAELERVTPRRSLRAVFLPRRTWLALFWGFQVPYVTTGLEIDAAGRRSYWVSTRHPDRLTDAIRRASPAPEAA